MKLEPKDVVMFTYVVGSRRFHVVAEGIDAKRRQVFYGWEQGGENPHSRDREFATTSDFFFDMAEDIGGRLSTDVDTPGLTLEDVGFPTPKPEQVAPTPNTRLRLQLTTHEMLLVADGRCLADDDGDCTWAHCPQIMDNEPEATGRHCPRDIASRKRFDPDNEGRSGNG